MKRENISLSLLEKDRRVVDQFLVFPGGVVDVQEDPVLPRVRERVCPRNPAFLGPTKR